jgi:hypothetical protein
MGNFALGRITRRLLLLSFACCACTKGQVTAPAASAASAANEGASAAPALLVNRIWTLPEPAERPGVIKAFLSDGTLLQDSCWETHRLSHWQSEADGSLLWREDGVEIRAAIVTLNQTELVLWLDLVDGPTD